jgi:hypothetical protein
LQKPELQLKNLEPINVKSCVSPTPIRGRKMKFERFIEGPPKPKRKIRNQENYASGRPKWEIENSIFKL